MVASHLTKVSGQKRMIQVWAMLEANGTDKLFTVEFWMVGCRQEVPSRTNWSFSPEYYLMTASKKKHVATESSKHLDNFTEPVSFSQRNRKHSLLN